MPEAIKVELKTVHDEFAVPFSDKVFAKEFCVCVVSVVSVVRVSVCVHTRVPANFDYQG